MGDVGKMRHLMRLQSPVTTRDAGGGFAEEYTDVDDIWCDIKPVRENITTQYGQRDMRVTYRIKTRYRSDVATGQRLLDPESGETYIIDTAVDPDMRKTYLEIMARQD